MFGAFIVLSVFPVGWHRKYQGEQVSVKGHLCMGDVKNLVMADRVLIIYWVAVLSLSVSLSLSKNINPSNMSGAWGSIVVKALRYYLDSLGIDSWW
jgi:uncharacterized membrane-anchored protein